MKPLGEIIAGTYEIEKRIGAGGGGVVYLARHLRLDKKVVLKADKRKITTHPEMLRREVDALKDLSHTYIPTVYDYFMEDEIVYTVIDYIDGESMDKPLRRGEKFSQAQVIKWACQLLEALGYLHRPIHGNPPKGIVHSDIKPANIMLRENGDICLIDFNIALALGEENVVGLSAGYASPEHYGLDFSGESYNTNRTGRFSEEGPITDRRKQKMTTEDADRIDMPPTEKIDFNAPDGFATEIMQDPVTEVMTGQEEEKVLVTMSMEPQSAVSSGKKVIVPDVRSDIYSLGATLYHFLSGVRPAKNAMDVIPLTNVSPQIADIISKAMAPNPDMRYQSAEEMLWAFEHLRENDKRTKKLRRGFGTAITLAACILGAGLFSTFTGLKRMEAGQRALTLAEYSENALEKGDIDGAVDNALQALPQSNIFTPGYIPEARYALANALGVYDLSDGYKAHMTVEMPAEIFKLAISPDGKVCAAVYSFELCLFDTETGNIIGKLPVAESALSDVVFVDNENIAYAGPEGISIYSVTEGKNLWTGEPATYISVSDDGSTVAGVFKDETSACLYDIKSGKKKAVIDFGGKKQRVVQNDIYTDPKDSLFKLSPDGKYLAVSFEDGGLMIYDTVNQDESIIVFETSDYVHFEGGFSGRYFAFSGKDKKNYSEFIVVDPENMVETIDMSLTAPIKCIADKNAIYISVEGTAVTVDPVSGEQREAAYTDKSDIRQFSVSPDGKNLMALTDNEYFIFDKKANKITVNDVSDVSLSAVAGNYAILGGRDTPVLKILKKEEHGNETVGIYDATYLHDEARTDNDGQRLMLFDYKGFMICDNKGSIIKQTEIPDPEKVHDQQYSRKSGNLSVIYNDGLRIYSGTTGEEIFSQTELKSVFYAPYGISILDGENNLRLIDTDTGSEIFTKKVSGDFGAYCGMVVDSGFLDGGKLIGAAKIGGSYIFAVAKDNTCHIYDNNAAEKFVLPLEENSEAFFTDNTVVLAPMNGTPKVYELEKGKKINDLEGNAYMTYLTQTNDYVISEYTDTTKKQRYGILLDKNTYEPLAYLPYLTDICGDSLIFDYGAGYLRKSDIYSIDELIQMGKNRKQGN